MKKIHLCCGDVYLHGYINCDIDGFILSRDKKTAVKHLPYRIDAEILSVIREKEVINLKKGNPNETTIDKYFKFPFEWDVNKRIRKNFIIDKKMNILEEWEWQNNSINEIVSVSAFEHFEHLTELPFIIEEAHRVLKRGGIWKFDFPDIKKVVELFIDNNPELCAELIYCNHKNKYSVHQWSYTKESVKKYLPSDKWMLEFKDVVKHDYPMQGVWAYKR